MNDRKFALQYHQISWKFTLPECAYCGHMMAKVAGKDRETYACGYCDTKMEFIDGRELAVMTNPSADMVGAMQAAQQAIDL